MAHVAQNFTREKMAEDTLNVYAELLNEKQNGHTRLNDGKKGAARTGLAAE